MLQTLTNNLTSVLHQLSTSSRLFSMELTESSSHFLFLDYVFPRVVLMHKKSSGKNLPSTPSQENYMFLWLKAEQTCSKILR